MATSDAELVRGAWAAVGRGDAEAIASVFSADVRWHGPDDPDHGCHGREEAVDFVRRALADGVSAEATDVREAADRIVVVVQVHHAPEWGDQPEPHGEVVTVRDGEISEIVVYANVADAVRAVGQEDDSASAAAAAPVVELLHFEGCPGHERLLPTVERLVEEVGGELRVRAVETVEAADAERFLGSPTLRVDGVDVDPGAADRTDFGLKCRIYRSEAGQSGVPPEGWIRSALDRHARDARASRPTATAGRKSSRRSPEPG